MIFEKIIPLFLIFAVTYFLKKIKIFSKERSKIITKILIYIVVPAAIIQSISQIKIEDQFIYLPISALLIMSLLTLMGFLLAKLLKLKKEQFGAFVIMFPTLQVATIGYVFMYAIYGNDGLSRIALFDSANAIFLFTVVYFMACSFGNNTIRLKDIFFKILKQPILWAILIGFIINFTHFDKEFFLTIINPISNSLVLLTMVMLGLEFEFCSSWKLPLFTAFLKLFIGLLVGALISSIFELSNLEKIAVMIGSFTPVALLTLVFAKENNLDTNYVSNTISMSFLLSLFFLFIFYLF